MLEAAFVMDDKNKQAADALVECPSCHHTVLEKNMTMLFGRQLCLSCAGAWFVDEDGNDAE
jgi:formylmethanofuran dehydrogenase subunit E